MTDKKVNAKLKVSKLDAAKRQLETVIRLYFSMGDPVSIHTLTAAAYNALKDLNRKRGCQPLFMKERILNHIKKGREKEFWGILHSAENFFKHADKDCNETIDFNPKSSEYLIYEAIAVYSRLAGETPVLFKIFETWFCLNNPSLLALSDEQNKIICSLKSESDYLLGLGREGYFGMALPAFMQLK